AAANDPRGRQFLTDAVAKADKDQLPEALYCMGAFASLVPEGGKVRTDTAWAEPILVDLMTRKGGDGELALAPTVVRYSDIPGVLLKINTNASRKALVDFVDSREDGSGRVLAKICFSNVLLPVEDLRVLEAATHDES